MARILIAGGSLSGLLHAILLRKAGHSVDVYERVAEDLSSRGGGLATQDSFWRVLERAGIVAPNAPKPGVMLRERVVFNPDGSIQASRENTQLVTSWDTLYQLLRDALPKQFYHQGRTVKSVSESVSANASRVILTFEDGAQEEGDLVIAADGAGSALRSQLLPGHDPTYAGYVAWRGLVSEAALDPATQQALHDRMTFFILLDRNTTAAEPTGGDHGDGSIPDAPNPTGGSENEQILAYPVTGPQGETEPGKRRINFVWYRPTAEGPALDALLTGEDGTRYGRSIPPPAIAGRTIEAMRGAARQRLAPPMRALVLAADKPFLQLVNDLCSPTFVLGRVVLVGDAAVLPRPHPGAGTTKAFEDAQALADALGAADGPAWTSEATLAAALQQYEGARLEPDHALWAHSRFLGEHLTCNSGDGSAPGQDQHPQTLLEKTALGM